MDAPISKELIDFIRHECAVSVSEEIIASTRMQSDLGVYGDDAMEFLVAYSSKFQVDVTNFMAADYFDGEGPDVLGFVLALFIPARKQRKDLTVGHLQKGIIAKRLDEQVIHNA